MDSSPWTSTFAPQKDLYGYICSFKSEEGTSEDDSHPASLIQELLNDGDVNLRCQQLDSWYQEDAQLRGMPYLYKPVGQEPLFILAMFYMYIRTCTYIFWCLCIFWGEIFNTFTFTYIHYLKDISKNLNLYMGIPIPQLRC